MIRSPWNRRFRGDGDPCIVESERGTRREYGLNGLGYEKSVKVAPGAPDSASLPFSGSVTV